MRATKPRGAGTPAFATLIESRRNRSGEWYKVTAGKIDTCSVPVPVRKPPEPAKP